MMSLEEKRVQAANEREKRRRDDHGMNQRYLELFESELGAEVLADMGKRFSAEGRRFKYDPRGGPIDPLAAAVRDGEGAVINFIKSRMEAAKTETRA